MGRRARYTDAAILAAASGIVSAGGPAAATIGAIASAIGAPNGSIYHRFESRDVLLGRLWLRKAEFFQDAFAAALAHPDPRRAAMDAALSLPRAARADLEGARIMLLHRREDFLSDAWPAEMQSEAVRLGRQVDQLLRDCSRRLFGDDTKSNLLKTAFAVLDVPFAATRRYVAANRPPPPEVDPLVAESVAAIVGAGRLEARDDTQAEQPLRQEGP